MPIEKVDVDTFLLLAQNHVVFDVRSPSEFAYAHIPDACSLPIFTDQQRAEIGTTYKQVSREEAIKIGLDYFGPNLNAHLRQVEKNIKQPEKDNQKVLLHCWRGGMRSAAMAWLLSFYGFEVVLLEGGYKAYRKWVLQTLDFPFSFNVIGGYTGSGKTELLEEFKKKGLPIINLEQLAHHKGSAFGGLGMPKQPSQEQFENDLAGTACKNFEISEQGDCVQQQRIWIENESQRIGTVNLTNSFYDRLKKGKLYTIQISFEQRLLFITSHYGKFDKEKLVNATSRIQKRLGGLNTKNAIDCLIENDVIGCFTILLSYYDREYIKSWQRNPREELVVMLPKVDAKENVIVLMKYLTEEENDNNN